MHLSGSSSQRFRRYAIEHVKPAVTMVRGRENRLYFQIKIRTDELSTHKASPSASGKTTKKHPTYHVVNHTLDSIFYFQAFLTEQAPRISKEMKQTIVQASKLCFQATNDSLIVHQFAEKLQL